MAVKINNLCNNVSESAQISVLKYDYTALGLDNGIGVVEGTDIETGK